MGSTLGRILGKSPVAGSASRVTNVRRPNDPSTEAEVASPVDPSLHQPDQDLLTKLKDVYVESTTNTVTQENPFGSERITSSSKLPQDRTSSDSDALYNVNSTTEGYLTAHQVLDIFDKRSASESEWTAEKIASTYKISLDDATNLLKYYSSYRVAGKLDKRDPDMKLHPLHR